jgi:hypothetical protein
MGKIALRYEQFDIRARLRNELNSYVEIPLYTISLQFAIPVHCRVLLSLGQFRSEITDGSVIWTGYPWHHSNAAVGQSPYGPSGSATPSPIVPRHKQVFPSFSSSWICRVRYRPLLRDVEWRGWTYTVLHPQRNRWNYFVTFVIFNTNFAFRRFRCSGVLTDVVCGFPHSITFSEH